MASSSSSKKLTVSERESHYYIPQEIVADILKRLPVKSLLRFKCVSKLWLLLISSKRFVKTHLLSYSPDFPRIMLNLGHPNYRLLHCTVHSLISEQCVTKETTHNDFPAKEYMTVVGSCNGLLCLFFGCTYKNDLFVWNPCTRISKKLPPPNVRGMVMWGVFGFGYNESRDDYMVLGIFFVDMAENNTQVEIYSSRTNSWRIIGDFTFGVPAYCITSKFVAGKFHVPVSPDDSFIFDGGIPDILFDIISFDLENEVYGKIEHPDYGDDVERLFLEKLEGCLCVVCLKETNVDVWVMKEYGVQASWTKTVTIPYFNHSWIPSLYLKPLVIFPSEEILLVFKDHYVVDDRHFVVYDLKDNSLRVLGPRSFGDFKADVYVESLAWPAQDEMPGRQDQ